MYAQIARITVIGAVINIILSALKAWAGIYSGSRALLADAVHSFTDLTTDIAVLIGGRFWTVPADAEHPYGHSRIETLVTGFIALIIIATGLGVGWDAIHALHLMQPRQPGAAAAVVACVAVLSKELLYQRTVRYARRLRSSALLANAWHHRSDAISSVPVAAVIIAATVMPAWYFIDQLAATLVAVFIVHAGLKLLAPTLAELSDRGIGSVAQQELSARVSAVAGVRGVHALRTRRLGAGVAVDLHVLVDGTQTVCQGHLIAEHIKQELTAAGDIVDVVVHIEPYGNGDGAAE